MLEISLAAVVVALIIVIASAVRADMKSKSLTLGAALKDVIAPAAATKDHFGSKEYFITPGPCGSPPDPAAVAELLALEQIGAYPFGFRL